MTAIGQLLVWASGELAAAGIAESRRDARLLLQAAAGLDAAQIIGFPERDLGAAAEAGFASLIGRRKAREPVSRILGRREFWSLPFIVSRHTLDPRPDSETLIEAVLERLANRQAPISILDLGTGTGCLLLALLSEYPAASGLGVDIQPGAVVTARENAGALDLAARSEFRVGDWGRDLTGPYDLVVSNPPYIAATAIPALDPEVAGYDPLPALDGGRDGLAAYRALAPDAARLLRPGGILVLEIGQGQGDSVCEIMARAGLAIIGLRADLAGIERCIICVRS